MKNLFLLFFFINVIMFAIVKDRFVYFLPKHAIHRSNEFEINEVRAAVKERTQKDMEFHKMTDKSVVPVFKKLLEKYNIKIALNKYIFKHGYQILKYKMKYNRARPWQIDSKLSTLKSLTSYSPSYPSGHAYQAWVLYRVLSRKYPYIKDDLYELAEYCTRIRVIAGLHYPSDGEFSKTLVMNLDVNKL